MISYVSFSFLLASSVRAGIWIFSQKENYGNDGVQCHRSVALVKVNWKVKINQNKQWEGSTRQARKWSSRSEVGSTSTAYGVTMGVDLCQIKGVTTNGESEERSQNVTRFW